MRDRGCLVCECCTVFSLSFQIAFWFLENDLRVLIAACDTFRAGAVEQLRTHRTRLDTMHPGRVHLYEKGYGKDAAAIAMEAIQFGELRPVTNTFYPIALFD